VRRLSFVLLRIEAILLVFPTVLGGTVLLGTAELMWRGLWNRGEVVEALMWALMLLGMVAEWWLLLRYFYAGQRAAREVPAAIWIFAALIALLSLIGFATESDDSPLKFLSAGMLFVPTLVHLSAEVWLMRPEDALEPAHGK
jgi:hypothetical protein